MDGWTIVDDSKWRGGVSAREKGDGNRGGGIAGVREMHALRCKRQGLAIAIDDRMRMR